MSEGNEDSEKVAFGSSEWLARARQILEELVAEHGEAGTSFSVCEVFTDAPSGLIGPEDNVAAWHFSIVDCRRRRERERRSAGKDRLSRGVTTSAPGVHTRNSERDAAQSTRSRFRSFENSILPGRTA